MTPEQVVELNRITDQRTIKECKECPHLRIESGKPICYITEEHHESECQVLTIT